MAIPVNDHTLLVILSSLVEVERDQLSCPYFAVLIFKPITSDEILLSTREEEVGELKKRLHWHTSSGHV